MSMHLLIIEDEGKMATILRRGLEEEGMEVTVAADGERGLEEARRGAYDLILLDLGLPGRDGLEVARELREEGHHTPILMLTAWDSTEMKVRGLDAGADDYLTKPFEFAELLARIRALHRRVAPEAVTRLQVGDLTLNLLNRRATRAGVEFQLTGKEFELLKYFMEHPDEPLSRQVLTEKVWHGTFDNLTNVIEVYINYLRNKIDRNFEPRLIRSVRSVGYILRTPDRPSRILSREPHSE
jgi:DNA-binding response OmpR family regulator